MRFISTSKVVNLKMDSSYTFNNSLRLNESSSYFSREELISDIIKYIEFQYMYVVHSQKINSSMTSQYFLPKCKISERYLNHIYSVYKRVVILENNQYYSIQCSDMREEFIELKDYIINNKLDYWLMILIKSSSDVNYSEKMLFKSYKVLFDTYETKFRNKHKSKFLEFLSGNLKMSFDGYSFLIPFQNMENIVFKNFIECLGEKIDNVHCIAINNKVYSVIIKK